MQVIKVLESDYSRIEMRIICVGIVSPHGVLESDYSRIEISISIISPHLNVLLESDYSRIEIDFVNV